MAYTSSFGRLLSRAGEGDALWIKAAAQGAVLAASAVLVLWFCPWTPAQRMSAAAGIGAAWGAASLGAAVLARAVRSRKPSARKFWTAFGFGVFVRAAALAILMGCAWTRPRLPQAELLGAYAMALVVLMLLELGRLSPPGRDAGAGGAREF